MRISLWSRFSPKMKQAVIVIGGGTMAFAIHATITGNPKFYRQWIMPSMRLISAELAHKLAIKLAKARLMPMVDTVEPENLKCEAFGLKFTSPVGLAAGFDKDGEAVSALLKIGFSFVEVGSVTPEPQPGNDKPRVFRLTEDGAIINRYGFNSEGHDVVHERLAQTSEVTERSFSFPDDRNFLNDLFWTGERDKFSAVSGKVSGVIGVNLGKNKTSPDAVGDYVRGVEKFGDVADYLVINVSSPNTPGLRDMQARDQLKTLVEKVVAARDKLPRRVPLLVKIAPDLTDQDKVDIAAVLARPGSGVDGLIVSNTTVSRPDTLTSSNKSQPGGLSGEPLRDLSTQVIRDMFRLTHGRLPIIGVGGIASGEDAYVKLRAGASLVQLYTALALHGPPVVNQIKRQLSQIVQEEGLSGVSEAVGADHRPNKQKQPDR